MRTISSRLNKTVSTWQIASQFDKLSSGAGQQVTDCTDQQEDDVGGS